MKSTTASILADAVNTELEALRRKHPRATERRISTFTVEKAAGILRHVAKDGCTGEYVYSRFGGFVPNSYKGEAYADRIEVTLDVAASGDIQVVDVKAVRTSTSVHRSRGEGPLWHLRHRTQQQRVGRLVA